MTLEGIEPVETDVLISTILPEEYHYEIKPLRAGAGEYHLVTLLVEDEYEVLKVNFKINYIKHQNLREMMFGSHQKMWKISLLPMKENVVHELLTYLLSYSSSQHLLPCHIIFSAINP